MSMNLVPVVAITPSFGIGKDGTLPWAAAGCYLKSDLKYFRKVTSTTRTPSKINAALMGR